MKTKIFTVFMSLILLAIPAISLASTYQFIDTNGNLQSVEANSSSMALTTARQLGIHSGVILVREGNSNLSTPMNTGGPVNTGGPGHYYQFIDTSGNLQGLWAINSSVALATAYQLGIHSGVILGPIDH